jgi:hypothetical protein
VIRRAAGLIPRPRRPINPEWGVPVDVAEIKTSPSGSNSRGAGSAERQGPAYRPSDEMSSRSILRPLVIVGALLAGCGDADVPSVEQPFQVRIFSHCGVDWQRLAYEGQLYHLKARNEVETESTTRGWKDPETVTIIEADGRLLAIGPDGSD